MNYYVGKDDPLQHLQWFEDAVSIRPMTDAFKCRLFAITLKDKARDWFHQLPTGSIYCFEDLSRSFQLRFSTSKKRKRNPESIFLIKQRADESLAQYVDRFQEEMLDIQEVPGFALQMAFTVGLREGFFKMILTRKAPLSFEWLMEKAAKEIAMEAANPAFSRKLARLTEVEQREPGGGRQPEGRRREELRRRSIASTSQTPPPDEKITFSRRDLPDHEDPFCDALVIRTAIENFTVSCILVDNGSSINVIFKKAFNEMRVESRRVLAADGTLFGFSGERKEVEGGVGLQVTLGGLSRNCRFVIVDAPSSYNAIFGRPLISAFRCVPSSFHQCLKLNSGGTQIRVRGDPKAARECYVTAVNTISWMEDVEELGARMEREELGRVGAGVEEDLVAEEEMAEGEELEIVVERGIAVEPVMAGEQVAGGEELGRAGAGVEGSLVVEEEMDEGEGLEKGEGGKAQERVAAVEVSGVGCGSKDLEEELREQEEEEPSRLRAAVEVLEVEILTKDGRKEKIKISGELTPQDQEEIRKCVEENIDVFAWSAADMPGVDADVACHRLNLDPGVRPIQQKKRAIASKMAGPIREEVEKLLRAGFISANRYPGWVSNVVMVKRGRASGGCVSISLS
ncbi:hypothetical protein KSP39_PZI007465 [Platanthera zijinensis]|uniref:Retrotransposon gag domain-containing protein n=1 Tax=Platanthera zijinensis TaxID=2320716 RepID=A0AAP0BR21_9ASPA